MHKPHMKRSLIYLISLLVLSTLLQVSCSFATSAAPTPTSAVTDTVPAIPTHTTTARIILTKTPLVSGTLIPTNLPPTDTLVGTVLESKVSEIAFVSPYKGNYAIYTVMTDGTKLTILTQDMVFIFSPHWSPKATDLFFQLA